MKKNFIFVLLFLVLISLIFTSCGGDSDSALLTIGGKADTEAYVLANLASILLEEEGYQVEKELGVESVLAREALVNGEVDLYYDYTGTAYTLYYEQSDDEVMRDPEAVYQWVKEADQEEGIVWLDKLDFNNTYTIMLREEDAEDWGIETITDLAESEEQTEMAFGTSTEFDNRPDGLQALMDEYDIEFGEIETMSAGIVYQALRDEKLEAGMGYATDGRIAAFGFINLKDDRDFFPVYNPAPLVREEVLEKYPEIERILGQLNDRLTNDEIRSLNKAVDINQEDAEDVARDWLEEEGLI